MDENDDALRRYIDKLETWAEDEPPTAAEIRELKSQIPLNENDRDKLDLLAENHIRRAREALNAGSNDQAIAELARASQLQPLDPLPRVELAEIYLLRSLSRGYGRRDRQKSMKLAQAALTLSPGNQSARNFLNEYRRMNADFRTVKNRRLLWPLSVVVVVVGLAFWWQKDWVITQIRGNIDESSGAPGAAVIDNTIPPERELSTDSGSLALSGLNARIIQSSVGRRNDSSYVRLRGRLSPDTVELGKLSLELRGRDQSGALLFSIPWEVRDEESPRLQPGDTQPLALFRWLADSEIEVDRLELAALTADTSAVGKSVHSTAAEVVWDSPRPESASLSATIRNKRVLEAYDRQVLLMEISMANTGSVELTHLEAAVSVDGQRHSRQLSAVNHNEPALEPGERRIWPVSLSMPLDAEQPDIGPVTIRVVDASR